MTRLNITNITITLNTVTQQLNILTSCFLARLIPSYYCVDCIGWVGFDIVHLSIAQYDQALFAPASLVANEMLLALDTLGLR